MNSKRKGDTSEAYVKAMLIRKGYNIYEPATEDTQSDLVVDTCEGLKRVQVKTARDTDTGIVFNTSKISSNKTENWRKEYDKIDYFIVFKKREEREDEYYTIHSEEAPSSTMSIRHEPCSQKQPNINWFEDYVGIKLPKP